jgi:acyl carrier protein
VIRTELKGFEVTDDDVKGDASFESLGLDSLDLVELSVRIEDAYGIDIEEDDLKDVWTIDNAIDVVLAKLGQS